MKFVKLENVYGCSSIIGDFSKDYIQENLVNLGDVLIGADKIDHITYTPRYSYILINLVEEQNFYGVYDVDEAEWKATLVEAYETPEMAKERFDKLEKMLCEV